MAKIKLNLGEIYQLSYEINGVQNQQTGEKVVKGILDESLPISLKYHLSKLSDNLLKEIEYIDKLKEEHITKVGIEDAEGRIYVPMRINEVFNDEGKLVSADINPVYAELQDTFNKFLMEEFEIEYREFTLEELDVKTEVNPKILFKLIKPLTPSII